MKFHLVVVSSGGGGKILKVAKVIIYNIASIKRLVSKWAEIKKLEEREREREKGRRV